MLTTDNDTFNKILDVMLTGEDRRLMIVTPERISGDDFKLPSVGCVLADMDPKLRAAIENNKLRLQAQIAAMDKLLAINDLAKRLNVKVLEI